MRLCWCSMKVTAVRQRRRGFKKLKRGGKKLRFSDRQLQISDILCSQDYGCSKFQFCSQIPPMRDFFARNFVLSKKIRQAKI